MTVVDKASIDHFVRHTLGCRCPDDVFDSVVAERTYIPESATPCARLVIGNRLLIYVLQVPDGLSAASAVPEMARQGRAERDACSYNRFRLVLACNDPTSSLDSFTDAFAQAVGEDDRAHLHVLATSQLPHVLRSPGALSG